MTHSHRTPSTLKPANRMHQPRVDWVNVTREKILNIYSIWRSQPELRPCWKKERYRRTFLQCIKKFKDKDWRLFKHVLASPLVSSKKPESYVSSKADQSSLHSLRKLLLQGRIIFSSDASEWQCQQINITLPLAFLSCTDSVHAAAQLSTHSCYWRPRTPPAGWHIPLLYVQFQTVVFFHRVISPENIENCSFGTRVRVLQQSYQTVILKNSSLWETVTNTGADSSQELAVEW